MTAPIGKWKSGHYELAEWENSSKDGKFIVTSLSLTKSWKKGNEWEQSAIKGILPNDLQRIQLILNECQKKLMLKSDQSESPTKNPKIEPKNEDFIDGSSAELVVDPTEAKLKKMEEMFANHKITEKNYLKLKSQLKK